MFGLQSDRAGLAIHLNRPPFSARLLLWVGSGWMVASPSGPRPCGRREIRLIGIRRMGASVGVESTGSTAERLARIALAEDRSAWPPAGKLGRLVCRRLARRPSWTPAGTKVMRGRAGELVDAVRRYRISTYADSADSVWSHGVRIGLVCRDMRARLASSRSRVQALGVTDPSDTRGSVGFVRST